MLGVFVYSVSVGIWQDEDEDEQPFETSDTAAEDGLQEEAGGELSEAADRGSGGQETAAQGDRVIAP